MLYSNGISFIIEVIKTEHCLKLFLNSPIAQQLGTNFSGFQAQIDLHHVCTNILKELTQWFVWGNRNLIFSELVLAMSKSSGSVGDIQ